MLSRSLLVLAALAPLAAADTLSVPSEFATIQEAVDAAAEGDTILVSKGTYPESVSISGRSGLVLRGKGKPVIDAAVKATGLFIDESDHIEVSGFVVQDAVEEGIFVRGSSDCIVRRCTVLSGCDNGGIVLDQGLRVLVEKNRVEGVGGAGIFCFSELAPGATDSELLRNTIVSPAGHGIHLVGSGNLVERNVVEGDGDIGILVDIMSPDNTISRNKVLLSAGSGIEVGTGDGNRIERNRIAEAGGIGLLVNFGANGVTTMANRISLSTSEGLIVNSEDCELVKDRVVDAGADGVAFDRDGNVVTGLRAVRAGDDGFEIDGSNNTFNGCKSSSPVDDGFVVNGTGNTFNACKAKSSGDLGLNDLAGAGMNDYVDCKFGTSNL